MEGKLELFHEIASCEHEGQYILLSLKGLLHHLCRVEEKIYFFQDILSHDDFTKISRALKTLKHFLKFVLNFATIYKRPRAIKGTIV